MMHEKRREFLKSAALGAASSLVAGTAAATLPVLSANEMPTDGDQLTWNKAPCRFCGTGCHVQVGVENNRVVAVAGDQAADVNKGLLCVKGYHVGSVLYGKDRLTQPLLRQGQQYVDISWDQAIDTVAKRIMAAPEKSPSMEVDNGPFQRDMPRTNS